MYNKARAHMLTHYRYCTTEQNERKMGLTATHADCYTTDGAMMTVGFTTGLTRRPKAPQPYRHSHPSCMRKTSSRRSPPQLTGARVSVCSGLQASDRYPGTRRRRPGFNRNGTSKYLCSEARWSQRSAGTSREIRLSLSHPPLNIIPTPRAPPAGPSH